MTEHVHKTGSEPGGSSATERETYPEAVTHSSCSRCSKVTSSIPQYMPGTESARCPSWTSRHQTRMTCSARWPSETLTKRDRARCSPDRHGCGRADDPVKAGRPSMALPFEPWIVP